MKYDPELLGSRCVAFELKDGVVRVKIGSAREDWITVKLTGPHKDQLDLQPLRSSAHKRLAACLGAS